MNISAILITTPPHNTSRMIQILNDLDAVEVYHNDPQSGKIIAIQEAETIDDEVRGLKEIKKLPGIILAEMVQHYFGEDASQYSGSDLEKIDSSCGTKPGDSCIPAYLRE